MDDDLAWYSFRLPYCVTGQVLGPRFAGQIQVPYGLLIVSASSGIRLLKRVRLFIELFSWRPMFIEVPVIWHTAPLCAVWKVLRLESGQAGKCLLMMTQKCPLFYGIWRWTKRANKKERLSSGWIHFLFVKIVNTFHCKGSLPKHLKGPGVQVLEALRRWFFRIQIADGQED